MIKIIIADDEKLIRESLDTLMDWKSVGAEVVGVAADGAAALDLIRELSPQILLSDISMPNMDGIELIRTIREENLGCHVIFLSAYSEFAYAQSAVKYGAFDYILKPIDEDELMTAVVGCIQAIKQENVDVNSDEVFGGSMLVAQTVAYVKENYPTALLTEIARKLYISTTYLSCLFTREMHITFSKYLQKYRIKMAKKLLLNPEYRIYTVANMVGYTDIAHFSKTFKQLEGLTPIQFRNSAIN
ncbi:MAG: response regulator [Oscillospiraceae bacterium]|nr:response regulator [Oscillospiraceae bacterium]